MKATIELNGGIVPLHAIVWFKAEGTTVRIRTSVGIFENAFDREAEATEYVQELRDRLEEWRG